MEQWGNGRANEYYEKNLPSSVRRPRENDNTKDVEIFIRNKYQHKKYVASSIPLPTRAVVVVDESAGKKNHHCSNKKSNLIKKKRSSRSGDIAVKSKKEPIFEEVREESLLDFSDIPIHSTLTAPNVDLLDASTQDIQFLQVAFENLNIHCNNFLIYTLTFVSGRFNYSA